MAFIILCKYIPNGLDLRMATRSAHLDYLKANDKAVLAAGPFLDDAERMTGTMLIIDVPDEAAARHFAENDPYAKAGLFADVEIRRWRWIIKPPVA